MDINTIINHHWPMIIRIVQSYEANSAICEELSQDVVFAIWQAVKKQRIKTNTKAYIARIAHNLCISHVIKASHAGALEPFDEFQLTDSTQSPDHQNAAMEQKDRLLTAIRRLTLAERQIATLALEGFEPKDIAHIVGISPNLASVKLKRTKEKLKTLLEVSG